MSDVSGTDQLAYWVAGELKALGEPVTDAVSLEPMSGDAGGRRYFRLPEYPRYLAVHAPPHAEDSRTFVTLANYLREQGLHAPQIFAADYEQGFLLQENLGEHQYLSQLTSDNVEILYGEAMVALLCIQQSPRPPELPDYSPDKLQEEMQLFPDWFVGQLLGYELSDRESTMLQTLFAGLVDNALEQPQCFVHRDYHSRNLIHRQVGPPGMVDFQDGVWGPFTYDLVSLLRDCYIRWPADRVEHWVATYTNMAVEVGIVDPIPMEQVMTWFDLMGLQRHLKVLGIFARLALRDNKHSYLQDLPLVIRYTLEEAEQYPQSREFAEWFRAQLLPLVEKQPWYQDHRTAGYQPGE